MSLKEAFDFFGGGLNILNNDYGAQGEITFLSQPLMMTDIHGSYTQGHSLFRYYPICSATVVIVLTKAPLGGDYCSGQCVKSSCDHRTSVMPTNNLQD